MNSLWIDEIEKINSNGELSEDTSANVCIIGAGISGITLSYYLTKKGYKTIVIERNEIGHGVTGHTTAKITSQHSLIYHYLSNQYGIKFAKKYFEANEEAIKNIEEIVRENNIDCDFERKNNYIYTINEENVEKIDEEAESLKYININAEKVEKSDLPFKIQKGVVFKNQAQFNPLKYLAGLTRYILKQGGRIYTNSLCTDIKRKDEEYEVYANGHKVYAKYVVLASQYPFLKIPGFYFAKMYQASSYVIGIKTKEKLPKDMYLSIDEPNFSFRKAGDILLIIYEEIFKSTRFKPITNKDEMKNMLVDSTKSLVLDRIKAENIETDDIKPGSGAVVDLEGSKVGVYKDENGKPHFIKPVCTHLGCILEWNDADKTWDCPCHGSRYDKYGKNIYGPATKNL